MRLPHDVVEALHVSLGHQMGDCNLGFNDDLIAGSSSTSDAHVPNLAKHHDPSIVRRSRKVLA